MNSSFYGKHILTQLCPPGMPLSPKQIGLPVIIDEYGRVNTAYPFHYLPIPERTIRRRRNGNTFIFPTSGQAIIEIVFSIPVDTVGCKQKPVGIVDLLPHPFGGKGELLHMPVHQIGRRKHIIRMRTPAVTGFVARTINIDTSVRHLPYFRIGYKYARRCYRIQCPMGGDRKDIFTFIGQCLLFSWLTSDQ